MLLSPPISPAQLIITRPDTSCRHGATAMDGGAAERRRWARRAVFCGGRQKLSEAPIEDVGAEEEHWDSEQIESRRRHIEHEENEDDSMESGRIGTINSTWMVSGSRRTY